MPINNTLVEITCGIIAEKPACEFDCNFDSLLIKNLCQIFIFGRSEIFLLNWLSENDLTATPH